MDVSWRIKELLAQSGMNQAELAQKAGVSQQYISAVSNGKKIPLENLETLCRCFHISLSEFFQPFSEVSEQTPQHLLSFFSECRDLSPEDIKPLIAMVQRLKAVRREALLASEESTSESSDNEDGVLKPVLGEAAAGRQAVYRPGDDEDCIRVPRRYASSDYYVIRAHGDSMEPLIHDGGCVVVHYDMPPSNGDLALIHQLGQADHEYLIKRYFEEGKMVRLVSVNKNYDDKILSPHQIARCERVVYVVT